MRFARILIGIAVICLLLGGASWAVRDCEVAIYMYENCVWLGARDALGLPQSKLLRALFLLAIGLSLLGGIYCAWRFAFPRSQSAADGGPAEGSRTE